MNNLDKKRVLQEYRIKQMEEFEKSLPMKKNLFYELFDYLNDKSETVKCKHDFSLTNEFLKDKNVDIEKVLEFLQVNGAGCDCEVILMLKKSLKNKF